MGSSLRVVEIFWRRQLIPQRPHFKIRSVIWPWDADKGNDFAPLPEHWLDHGCSVCECVCVCIFVCVFVRLYLCVSVCLCVRGVCLSWSVWYLYRSNFSCSVLVMGPCLSAVALSVCVVTHCLHSWVVSIDFTVSQWPNVVTGGFTHDHLQDTQHKT